MTESIEIPNKSHFKMDEVVSLTGVKSYVLRFWETEFDEISPISSSGGQKLFEHKDIEAILKVKKLLFEDKLTIEKAKAIMSKGHEEIIFDAPIKNSAVEKSEDAQFEATVPETSPQTAVTRSMSESDIQKITLAKDILSEMIELTKSLQERHNWR